jgi:hypothetical protein
MKRAFYSERKKRIYIVLREVEKCRNPNTMLTPDAILHRIRCGYLACMKCFRTIRTSETLEHSRNFEFWFLEKIMAFVFLMKMVWLLLTHQQRQLEIIAQNHQESSWGYWRILFQYFGFSVYDLCEWIVYSKLSFVPS